MNLPERTLQCLPGISVLSAVLAAQMPLLLFPDLSPWLAVLFISVPVLCLIPFFPPEKILYLFVLPASVAFCSILLYRANPPSGGLESLLINGKAGGEFEILLNDPAVSSSGVPYYIRGEVIRYRLSGDEEWQTLKTGNTVMAAGLKQKDSPHYGDTFSISGTLTVPSRPEFSFDYGEYLRRSGIAVLLYADSEQEAVLCRRGDGFTANMFSLRNRLLERIAENMKSAECKALCEGILFGFTQNIPAETKQDFIRTGTIHILSVSGTHVGLFAALLLIVLVFLPFRLRLFLTVLLTFLYAWLTGLRGPSFRAAFMLAFLLGPQILLLRTNPLNTLLLAASVLLIIQPEQIFQPGFLYSFLTVAALLTASPQISELLTNLNPDSRFLPPKYQSSFRFFCGNMLRRTAFAVCIALTAGVAGFALTAYLQGLCSALSVLVNLCILPLVWLCFPAALLAVFFNTWGTWLLEKLLSLILFFNHIFSDAGVLQIAEPPLWSVFVFISVFFLTLILKRKYRLCGGAVLMFLIAWWCIRTPQQNPEILLISGGSIRENRVAVVAADPAGRCADILNMPDTETALETAAFLRKRGISRCRYFTAQDHKLCSFAGFQSLRQQIDFDETALDSRLKKFLWNPLVFSEYLTEKESGGLTKDDSGDTFRTVFPDSGIAVTIFSAPDGSDIVSAGGHTVVLKPSLQKTFILLNAEQQRK